MSYFSGQEAARRYDRYRPKVHTILLDWMERHLPGRRFGHALDIACGSGDSMQPLRHLAEHVDGIDLSVAMLERARDKGLRVRCCSYRELPEASYDLLTTGMAFHWFDPVDAVAAYKRASADEAVWLVYNFHLVGNRGEAALHDWLQGPYLMRFPSPRRGRAEFVPPPMDSEISLVGQGNGTLPVRFTREALIGYLTTQSNVEALARAAGGYREVERILDTEMPAFDAASDFAYAYTYSIVQFRRA